MPIEAYIDGACSGNPGPGGWGVVLVTPKGISDLSGYDPQTTNNRMELTAAIMLLKHLSPDVHVVIHADSQYVVKGVTEWMANWKRNGWRNAQKKPVENQALWEELDHLVAERAPGVLRWQWVKGHAGHPMNERADRLAVDAIQRRGSSFEATKTVPGTGPTPRAVPAAPRLFYARHGAAWYRDARLIPGLDSFAIEVQTDGLTGMFTIEILSDDDGPFAKLRVADGQIATMLAVPDFFRAFAAAYAARGEAGMSADAVEILLLNFGATEITPRERPANA